MATKKRPTTGENIPVITKAEELCRNVNGDLKAQAITLAKSVLTLQEKIEQQTPIYKNEPLALDVTLERGETIKRANPFVQEFRATVKDYAAALKNLQEILAENETEVEGSPIEALRNRFKVG